MIHLENGGYSRRDAPDILRRARSLTGPSCTIRDVRIASVHTELDVTVPDGTLPVLIRSLKSLGALRDAHHIVEAYTPKEEAIRQGIDYFNGERFWECHEAFEGVWKGCHEGERDLVQGIILAAAGLVHHQKNDDARCVSIFGRALKKLANCAGTYHTISVESLRDRLGDMVRTGRVSTFEI